MQVAELQVAELQSGSLAFTLPLCHFATLPLCHLPHLTRKTQKLLVALRGWYIENAPWILSEIPTDFLCFLASLLFFIHHHEPPGNYIVWPIICNTGYCGAASKRAFVYGNAFCSDITISRQGSCPIGILVKVCKVEKVLLIG